MSDLFIKSGDEYLMTGGGTLLLVAGAYYGPPEETTPEGKSRASSLIAAILAVAAARGFAKGDLLETLLSRNEVSPRVLDLARQVDKHLGKDGFAVAIKRAGGNA